MAWGKGARALKQRARVHPTGSHPAAGHTQALRPPRPYRLRAAGAVRGRGIGPGSLSTGRDSRGCQCGAGGAGTQAAWAVCARHI